MVKISPFIVSAVFAFGLFVGVFYFCTDFIGWHRWLSLAVAEAVIILVTVLGSWRNDPLSFRYLPWLVSFLGAVTAGLIFPGGALLLLTGEFDETDGDDGGTGEAVSLSFFGIVAFAICAQFGPDIGMQRWHAILIATCVVALQIALLFFICQFEEAQRQNLPARA